MQVLGPKGLWLAEWPDDGMGFPAGVAGVVYADCTECLNFVGIFDTIDDTFKYHAFLYTITARHPFSLPTLVFITELRPGKLACCNKTRILYALHHLVRFFTELLVIIKLLEV
jgi:hypothetical protein